MNPDPIEYVLYRLLMLPNPIAARLACRWALLWNIPAERIVDAEAQCSTPENQKYFEGRTKLSFDAKPKTVTVRISGSSNPGNDGIYYLFPASNTSARMVRAGSMVALNPDGTAQEAEGSSMIVGVAL